MTPTSRAGWLGPVDPVDSPVAEARRAAGLTKKELSRRLGVSLWELELIEGGERDVAPHVSALKRHLSVEALDLDVEEPPLVREAAAGRPPAGRIRRLPARVVPRLERSVWLILGSLALLLVIRLFTEVVPVLPGPANLVDLAILPVLIVAAAVTPRRVGSDLEPRWLIPIAVAFLVLCLLATLANLSRVEIGPVSVFVYGILSPLVLYVAVYRLWPAGNAISMSRFIVALGVLQIPVVIFLQLPEFLGSGDRNPDLISGTFGENAHQLVFFLLVFVALLAGIYVGEKGRMTARLAPFLAAAALMISVLAQFRSLLLTTVLVLVLVTLLLSLRGGRGVLAGAGVALAFLAVVAFAVGNIPSLKLEETLELDPLELASKRLGILDPLDRMYTDEPRFVATGTGPGTFSSRAWKTFDDADDPDNPAGSLAQALTGGEPYRTDVSRDYLDPARQGAEIVSGSRAVTTPFSSYTSVAAETGLLGVAVLVAIYFGMLAVALRRSAYAIQRCGPGEPLPALILAATVGLFVLIQLGVFENWLEVARVTLPAWALLAIANREFDARFAENGG